MKKIHSQKRAEAYYKHRFAQRKKADYERAIVDFTKAIEHNPKDVFAYNNRGVAYYNKGRFYRAVDDFSKVISLTPDDPFAYYGCGLAYRNLLVFEKSIQDFSTTIRLKPEAAADAYKERGVTYHSKGDIDKAIADTITLRSHWIQGLQRLGRNAVKLTMIKVRLTKQLKIITRRYNSNQNSLSLIPTAVSSTTNKARSIRH